MLIDVITIFPEMFEPAMSLGVPGTARQKGALEFRVHDLRNWALPGVHRQVDDAPYGGGPGMVMRPEPFFEAVDAVSAEDERLPYVVMLTPQGKPLDQQLVEDLSSRDRVLLLCGRYEGFDDRIRSLADLELSVGDYVVSGGEMPAMVVIDAIARLLPGVLGDADSATDESFAEGLLEYPQFTRPASYRGMDVPEVLLSGDHARIAAWRRATAIQRTEEMRPDLLGEQSASDRCATHPRKDES